MRRIQASLTYCHMLTTIRARPRPPVSDSSEPHQAARPAAGRRAGIQPEQTQTSHGKQSRSECLPEKRAIQERWMTTRASRAVSVKFSQGESKGVPQGSTSAARKLHEVHDTKPIGSERH